MHNGWKKISIYHVLSSITLRKLLKMTKYRIVLKYLRIHLFNRDETKINTSLSKIKEDTFIYIIIRLFGLDFYFYEIKCNCIAHAIKSIQSNSFRIVEDGERRNSIL